MSAFIYYSSHISSPPRHLIYSTSDITPIPCRLQRVGMNSKCTSLPFAGEFKVHVPSALSPCSGAIWRTEDIGVSLHAFEHAARVRASGIFKVFVLG